MHKTRRTQRDLRILTLKYAVGVENSSKNRKFADYGLARLALLGRLGEMKIRILNSVRQDAKRFISLPDMFFSDVKDDCPSGKSLTSVRFLVLVYIHLQEQIIHVQAERSSD